jgi:pimeloyl-ACP methyl ester carboxylesterase
MTVEHDGIELWTQSFGERSHPAVLLIMGATAPALLWEDELCLALAERGLFVIRYDNRDVGRSSTLSADRPYTLRDMAGDAVAILDAYDIAAAHVVGNSMGGGIAQYLALEHRVRVHTLTLLFTSPALQELILAAMGQPTGCELAMPSSPELLALLQEAAVKPPLTRDEQIEFDLRRYGILAGSRYPFDMARWRTLLAECHDRSRDWAAASNHHVVMAGSDADLRPRLRELDVPTVVMHGTDDPAVPIAHGRALAQAIPGARFIEIDGFGHQFHPDVYPLWVDVIAEQVLAHEPCPA